jgi:hypothetical protein
VTGSARLRQRGGDRVVAEVEAEVPKPRGGLQVPEEKRPKINRSRTQKEATRHSARLAPLGPAAA